MRPGSAHKTGMRAPLPQALNGTRGVLLAVVVVFTCMLPALGQAQNLWSKTYFISANDGSSLSNSVRKIGRGGYELANGQRVSFGQWYGSRWADTHFTWMTELHPNFGVYWGFSTGERGEKYTIDPALRLGFVYQTQPTPSSTLSLSVLGLIGGNLSEDSCAADYGAIGGVQTVNCRLAASTLPPEETLNYMLDESPMERLQLHVRYLFRF